ncbi:MAG: hypothetical protein O3C10_13490 [Chloroflexi bacterium]|nr:hypothetical protein [Chloroflexota bacterium]
MPSIFMRVKVRNFDTFKSVVDGHEDIRRSYGITSCNLFREAGDDGAVTIQLQATDPEKAQEFLGSEQLQTAMMESTVQGPPDVWFAEQMG